MSPEFCSTGEYWTSYKDVWLYPLKHFDNLDIYEVYLPLQRPGKFPEDLDIGSCQLYATDVNGKPYRDYDVGVDEDERADCETWINP